MRKYEIHLPLTYGDGKPIEPEKMRRVREELVVIFGSSLATHKRAWKYEGTKYTEVMRIEIITTSDEVPKKQLGDFKERLKESLQHSDILILSHGIHVN